MLIKACSLNNVKWMNGNKPFCNLCVHKSYKGKGICLEYKYPWQHIIQILQDGHQWCICCSTLGTMCDPITYFNSKNMFSIWSAFFNAVMLVYRILSLIVGEKYITMHYNLSMTSDINYIFITLQKISVSLLRKNSSCYPFFKDFSSVCDLMPSHCS